MLSMIDIHKTFGRGDRRVQVLSNVSLDVAEGEVVGVVGSLRDGSTALLHMAAGWIQPDEGRVMFGEIDITELSYTKRDRFVTPQILWIDRKSPELMTVSRHVSLSLIAERRIREADRLVSLGLERMGVLECASCYLSDLSHWERLLVELARVVSTHRRLILVNDLFDDLNVRQMQEARRLLRSLVDDLGCGVLLRVSDLQSAWVADRVWRFAEGELTPVPDKLPVDLNVVPIDSQGLASRQGVSTLADKLTIPEKISIRVDDTQTISRFSGLAITMCSDDNQPPHFHVRSGEFTAKIRTDTLEVLVGNLPRREQRLVLAWAELRASELQENWRRARVGETLQKIEPLR
jgi:ABC-type lipoprotein export system ATPase subunit